MTFMNVFAYIEIAAGIIAAVQAVMTLKVSATNPLQAAELQAIAMPVLAGIQQLVPSANIPATLVVNLSTAIASTVNAFIGAAPVPVTVPAV